MVINKRKSNEDSLRNFTRYRRNRFLFQIKSPNKIQIKSKLVQIRVIVTKFSSETSYKTVLKIINRNKIVSMKIKRSTNNLFLLKHRLLYDDRI